MPYLKPDETMDGRVEELLERVRRSPQESERQRYATELGALAAAHTLTFRMPEPQAITVNVLRGDGDGLEPSDMDQDTIDYLVGVLDATYGGEAPAAVKANYLYHLTGQGDPVELTGPEFALEPQADDPDDELAWTTLQAERRGLTVEEATALAERERSGLDLPTAPAGSTGPTDREGYDLDDQDDPEPISAAERLRARTTKKSTKGKK